MALHWVVLAALVKATFVIVFIVLSLGGVLTWMDRRQSSMLQHRLGPMRANVGPFRLWGLLHTLADGIKMVMKEDFVPARGDRLLHGLAPVISIIPVFLVFCVIPFGEDLHVQALGLKGSLPEAGPAIPMQVARLNVGVLFVLAIASTGVLGLILGGQASDNRFGIIGAQRSMSQMISYEMALAVSLIGPLLVYGTVDLYQIVKWQEVHWWGFIVQPAAFVLFFVAGVAETKRVPFDMPEGESELAAGFHISYGSMKFAMFFLGEYMEVVILSGLMVTLFLGGWTLPIYDAAGNWGIHAEMLGIHWHWFTLPHWLHVAIGVGVFLGKLFALCWFQLMIRWTLPKFRYDQVMDLGWRYITPLALANVAITMVVIYLIN
jgi:NADH-quinone oxidoreductase subunit H